MKVHLTEIEHHFFTLGASSIAHISPIETTEPISSVVVGSKEILQDLGGGKLLIRKE